MQTVVFIIYHGLSHFNSCFKLAKQLVADHDVVFAGHLSFKQYIEAQGFIFYPLTTVPFGMGFEEWIVKQKKKNAYLATLRHKIDDVLYVEREFELNKMLTDLEPTTILLDAYQSTDFIVLYQQLVKKNIRFAMVQPMLPTAIKENTPPITSLVLPSDEVGIIHAVKDHQLRTLKKKFIDKVRYLGWDDEALIKRRLKKNVVPLKYLSPNHPLRGIALTNITEFVLAPKEFDFTIDDSPSQHYIGFNPELHRIEVSDMDYFRIDQEIRQKLNDHQGILIYCSFGSVQAGDTSIVTVFLEKLLKAVSDSNCVLIVSVSAIHHERAFSDLPKNVYFLKAAPQIEILSRADVFITHGGLSSIKESIYMGVPMLVYPLHNITDTNGNSSRVLHHKLGLRGDMLNDTVEDIDNKIIELVNNDLYKENIYALRQKDEAYAGKFIDLYNKLKPLG